MSTYNILAETVFFFSDDPDLMHDTAHLSYTKHNIIVNTCYRAVATCFVIQVKYTTWFGCYVVVIIYTVSACQ